MLRGSVPFDGQKKLHFQVATSPTASSAWGLIWTHGLTSSAQSESEGGWPFGGVAHLADTMPVARYDARGHGRSDTAERCCWPSMGGDLQRLRKVMPGRKVVLGGTSMGAAASLYAALEDPDSVAGLILATPPTCYETRRKFVPLYQESVDFARSQGLEAAKRAAETKARPPVFLESDAGRACFDIGWRAKFEMGVSRYCAALDGAIMSDLPPPEKLRALKVPTLVLAWQSDAQHPVSSAEMLKEELPHAELHVAKSWAEIEEFPVQMRDFLQRVQAQAQP